MPKVDKTDDDGREVVYPKVEAVLCLGADALTCAKVKELMGWSEETDEDKWKEDEVLLTDLYGKRVSCLNNVKNRRFRLDTAMGYAQDVLNRTWADSRNTPPDTPPGREYTTNGETWIVGRTGKVLSCQHRGAGLVLACQFWAKCKAGDTSVSEDVRAKVLSNWPDEPTVEAVIVRGVDESDFTVRTIDNVQSRTLADVLFTGDMFPKARGDDRVNVSRATEGALKFLWKRTGRAEERWNEFSRRMTHSEALDFLGRHPRLARCVTHVTQEDKAADGKRISKHLPLGVAAALMYMMGSGKSDGRKYRDGDPPAERGLNWDHWDKAVEFWRNLAAGTDAPEFMELRHALAALVDPDTGVMPNLAEKVAVVAMAWREFVAGKKLKQRNITPDFKVDEETGARSLKDIHDVGGIDLGSPKAAARAEELAERTAASTTPAAPKVTGQGTPAPAVPPGGKEPETLAAYKRHQAANPGKVLLFKAPDGYRVFGNDIQVGKRFNFPTDKKAPDGTPFMAFPAGELNLNLKSMFGAGFKVAVVEPGEAGAEAKVVDQKPPRELKAGKAAAANGPALRGGTGK